MKRLSRTIATAAGRCSGRSYCARRLGLGPSHGDCPHPNWTKWRVASKKNPRAPKRSSGLVARRTLRHFYRSRIHSASAPPAGSKTSRGGLNSMFPDLVASFFVVVIVVGVPILSWETARNEEVRSLPRPTLYLSAAVSEWLLALLAVFTVLVTGLGFSAAGFRRLPLPDFLSWSALIAASAIAALFLTLLLERHGLWPKESLLVHLLVPETARQKLWAVVVVAPTAALCEDFIYRGCLLAELAQWSQSEIFAWIVSSAAFGLTHVYQKWGGMLRAGEFGALLAYPVVRFRSLYPSMAAQFLFD